MSTPTQRHTKSHRNNRRSHHALKKTGLAKCKKCHQEILPHRACANCGTYRDRQVINVEKRATRRQQSKKTK